MCELALDAQVWDEWKAKLPVIVNVGELEQSSVRAG
jgi:hypothetical protein